MKVAIIGGGAAGFFAAIQVKGNHPEAEVTIFEKSAKVLSKVKISGGGRCNVTNGTHSIKTLAEAYPRGGKKLKKAFGIFNNKHVMQWFESRGVPLLVQDDNCVFPKSQDSQSIVDCFLNESKRLGVNIKLNSGISGLNCVEGGIEISVGNLAKPIFAHKVIICTGGSPQRKNLQWLELLGHEIIDPLPSLFTFNMPDENIKKLMGIVVEKTKVSLQGTKLKSDGPLLITHWGMSGPAILKLSAFGARILSEMRYNFNVQINWAGVQNAEIIQAEVERIVSENPNKLISNVRPYYLPVRLWHFLIDKMEFSPQKKWSELGKKGLHKIVTLLSNDVYKVKGKTTFKEEFVTCGGVSLNSIHFNTMESKVCPNLYFAGEVLDIDGITGGFNFQAII